MVKRNISFNDTVSNVKKICDLTLLNPKTFNKLKMLRVLHYAEENNTICIPLGASYYWLQVIQFVRQKSHEWGIALSDDFISNEINQFIHQLKLDKKKYGAIGKSVKEWVENFKKIPLISFRIILPVNNVDYRKDLDFGRVKLQKLNLTKLKKLTLFQKTGHFSAKEILQDLISSNETEIFVIIEVQANDEKQGIELAKLNLKRLIHAMRLFDPPSGITEREYHFPETHYHYLVIDVKNNLYTVPWSNLHLDAHIWRTEEYWRDVNPDWKKLSAFLFSNHITEVQSLILTGLHWYGDAGKETEDDLSKFLKYTYGLENLLIFDNTYNKGKRLAERLAKIFSRKNPADFKFYSELMSQYYDVRSGAIHSGELLVDSEDVATTHAWLRNLLFEYIRLSSKYADVKTMFKKEYSITI